MKKHDKKDNFVVPVYIGQMMMLSKTPNSGGGGGGLVAGPKSNLATASFSPKTSLIQDSNVVIPAVSYPTMFTVYCYCLRTISSLFELSIRMCY